MALDQLPPLTALRAFEAAARHKSFTKAANELNMTQAAVSYQIKQLEDRFGEPLFIRGTRQVSLSKAGTLLAPSITEAFEIIRRSFAEAQGHRDGLLTITTAQTFASSWLAKNFGSYSVFCKSMAVRLDISSEAYADFQSAGIDVAIRTGAGQWPGLSAKKLMHFDYAPMLSPKLMAQFEIKKPEDLLKTPMATPADPWWHTWFSAMDVDVSGLDKARGPIMDVQYIHGIAALSGSSVALLTPCLYRDELASGALIQPFDYIQKEDHAIWLCYPEHRKNWQKIKTFEDWLFPMLDETMPDRRV